jgi:Polyketide cyclase / dehydrase and lipid transport
LVRRREVGLMPGIAGDIIIDRQIEEVFDFVLDERNEPLYNAEMLRSEKVTDGPIGVGTRFRASHQQGRRTVYLDVQITYCDRPYRMASRTAMPGSDINGELTFEPVGSRTRMRWVWDVRLKGHMRALTPLVGFIGGRSETACWEGLKRYLESSAAPPTAEIPNVRLD